MKQATQSRQSRGVAPAGNAHAVVVHVPILSGIALYTGTQIFNGDLDIVAWEASLAAQKVAGDKNNDATIKFLRDAIKDGGYKPHEMKGVKVLGRSATHYQIMLESGEEIATCAVEHKFVHMKDHVDSNIDAGTVINMNGTAPGMFSLVHSSK